MVQISHQKIMEAIDVAIASGNALSSEVDLRGLIPCGVIMPAAWTAANLTFQAASASGGTFVDMYEDGTELSETAAASQFLILNPTQWLGVPFFKIRSGTTGTPVNQGADRTLTLMASRAAV